MELIWMEGFDCYNASAYPYYAGQINLNNNGRWTGGRYAQRIDGMGKKVTDVASDTFYLGCAFKWDVGGHFFFQNGFAGIQSNNFRMSLANTSIDLFRNTNDYIGSVTLPNPVFNGIWHYIELKAFSHASTGWFKMRLDNQLVVETGNMNTTNGTLFDSIWVAGYGGGEKTTGSMICIYTKMLQVVIGLEIVAY